MPRNLFLSFLGTTFYEETHYTFADGSASAPTRFVQLALLRKIREELTGASVEARIFTTDEAEAANWRVASGARAPRKGLEPVPYAGLERLLRDEGLQAEQVRVPNGDDEAQHWAIFNMIVASVQPGDRLYVDITHGFRSLPVLLVKALDFLVQVRGAEVVRVEYGAYKPGAQDHLVVDLTGLVVLDEWARAIHQVEQGGDFLVLAASLAREIEPLKKVFQAKLPGDLRDIPSSVGGLGEALEFCRLRKITENARRCVTHLEGARALLPTHLALNPLVPALDRLMALIRPMVPTDDTVRARLIAQLHAVKFLLDRQRYLNGYTLLRESLVDLIADRYAAVDGAPRGDTDAKRRRDVDSRVFRWFNHPSKGGEDRQGEHGEDRPIPPQEDPALARLLAEPWVKDAMRVIDPVNKLRNKLDHAGTSGEVPPAHKLEKDAREHIDAAFALVNRLFPGGAPYAREANP